MHYRQRIGRWGEDLAEKYLLKEGLIILSRNKRTPYGEIDLIAQHGHNLVFIEVKTRSNERFGFPEDGINYRKRKHLVESALYLSQEYQEFGETWRIDVISIFKPKDKTEQPRINWFKNAIEE